MKKTITILIVFLMSGICSAQSYADMQAKNTEGAYIVISVMISLVLIGFIIYVVHTMGVLKKNLKEMAAYDRYRFQHENKKLKYNYSFGNLCLADKAWDCGHCGLTNYNNKIYCEFCSEKHTE
jgi:membrane-anchored glycerophosphoryl diester phosphodiesterase (GDPDase)